MTKNLTIIDTFGFFFRNFYALPPLKNKDGFPTGLLSGFVNFISLLQRENSKENIENKKNIQEYIVFTLEGGGENVRKKLDPLYKANRQEAPADLLLQLPVAIEWIEKMGFKQLWFEGYEADDTIASVAKKAKELGFKVKIISHDKDLYQLIEDGAITLYDPVKKIDINEQKCIEKFGVHPSKIKDYLAIVGDTSDNIKGVKGIGSKGAVLLLEQFGSVEGIYENIENIEKARTKQLLLESRESAFLSKKLTTLVENLPVGEDFEEYKFVQEDPILKIKDELLKFDIKAVFKRTSQTNLFENTQMSTFSSNSPYLSNFDNKLPFNAILVDTKERLQEVLKKLEKCEVVAFDTETNSLDSKNAQIVGFSFCFEEENAYYVPIAHKYLGIGEQLNREAAKEIIDKIFTKNVIGQNIKYDLNILYHNFDFNIDGLDNFADTMVVSWLLDPSSPAGLDFMAKKYFNHEMIKFGQTVKKGEDFSSVHLEEALLYAAEDAWMTYKLYFKLYPMLDLELQKIAKTLEFKFINILLKMENNGIKIDLPYFKNLLNETNSEIERLSLQIFQECKTQFNINSPAQLAAILFDKLNLKPTKKTKTNFSTDESVLEGLRGEHSVIEHILDYREVHKLKTTYIEPLIKFAQNDKNSRVYTSFLQTGTATGRLSSKNPNLQNIPVKTQTGRKIRDGFVAQDGCLLVGIDYSQIELRLLAHFSGDPVLCNAFLMDEDIHLQTAVKIFGQENAKDKRNIAKTINFGLLYGMGARKLAQTLKCSQSEAKSYIENYFKSFSTVKNYFEQISNFLQQNGYVGTLLGRKRVFDFANATEFQKSEFIREGINTVFQGSAADLIKNSMIKIDSILGKYEAKLLLQIHDELIFEVSENEANIFSQEAKKIMEEDIKLNIPLKVNIMIAQNWGKLK